MAVRVWHTGPQWSTEGAGVTTCGPLGSLSPLEPTDPGGWFLTTRHLWFVGFSLARRPAETQRTRPRRSVLLTDHREHVREHPH